MSHSGDTGQKLKKQKCNKLGGLSYVVKHKQ